jgi:cysteinyl-tRNA synthetase
VLKLFDYKTKHKIIFEPQTAYKVSIYVCGPTVYDYTHLGHCRSAIVFDMLHRVLKTNNYDVTIVKNFTDIDDKILKKLKTTNQTLEQLTSYYIQQYQNDMKLLNILPNTIEPKATDNIQTMITMIDKMLKNSLVYKLNDGIYFDTSNDKQYGCISGKTNDENDQHRVSHNKNKKNQKDFVVWKFDTNDIYYKAPFGDGRPGWHTECSAMIDKYLSNKSLAYAVDIHGGGADLRFPHHENEATQTRVCHSQELAKYWIHNGFVNINNTKMSKSLGNSFYLKDILEKYPAEVVRFYMLCTNYATHFNFSESGLVSSKKRLDRLYRLKKLIYGTTADDTQTIQDIKSSLDDDMNSSKALVSVDMFVAESLNQLQNKPKDKQLKKQISNKLQYINDVLGIGYQDPYLYFQYGIDNKLLTTIDQLIHDRNIAKTQKDWAKADSIRDQLKALHISIMDTNTQTVWEKQT